MWAVLPLYADPSSKVRLQFVQFLQNIPSLHNSMASVVTRSFEDDLQKPVVYIFLFLTFRKLEDIPQVGEISISPKDIADFTFELMELISAMPLDVLVNVFY
jgi:hypothetical protein